VGDTFIGGLANEDLLDHKPALHADMAIGVSSLVPKFWGRGFPVGQLDDGGFTHLAFARSVYTKDIFSRFLDEGADVTALNRDRPILLN